MKEKTISEFMLERFWLKELDPQDKKEVEEALEKDSSLRSALVQLEVSDNELRLRYPASSVGIKSENIINFPQKRFVSVKVKISILAAAILLCVLLPFFIINRNSAHITDVSMVNDFQADRIMTDRLKTDHLKGQLPAGSEFFIYLKGDIEASLSQTNLNSQKFLREGDTVQLAYKAPAGTQYYGVIFSIDGRSVVTMHYPYLRGESSLLVSGRQVFLNEAYTLDDAPFYEVFVFVVCEQPLDINAVNAEAQKIARRAAAPEQINEISKEVFNTCEIETIMVLKR
jgi:hypothetical protein